MRATAAMLRLGAPSYAARIRQSTSIPSFSVCSGRQPGRKQPAKWPIWSAYESTSEKSKISVVEPRVCPGGVLGGMNVPESENGYLDRIGHQQPFLVSSRVVSSGPWPPAGAV